MNRPHLFDKLRADRLAAILIVLLAWACTTGAQPSPIMTLRPAKPDADQPIMPLDQVRIGMKGYGLTVFHGTRIEPFAVEVLSIINDSTPHHATIWVRCPDERMQLSGPVEGMSGSPIYLWNEGETKPLGEGGRLIGAFAFGYSLSKDCIVGVQPIEQMRDIATRKSKPDEDGDTSAASVGSWGTALTTLARLDQIARDRHVNPALTFRLEEIRRALDADKEYDAATKVAPKRDPQAPTPLMLPLTVGPRALADALGPLFEPLGLRPVAGDNLAGPPPPGVDADAAKLEPGAVLAVPLLFGDMDLSAAGTVTDVLDDGTVLGFGHPMFGDGKTSLPMATGYVHFIVPSIDTSFKRVGSLQMSGSLVRDESTGVMGSSAQTFTTAPVDVTVQHADGKAESFHYKVVNYRMLSGQLAAISVLRSILARQATPQECTILLKAKLQFADDHQFSIDTMLPGADPLAPAFELLSPLILMTNNPFKPLNIQSVQADVKVVEGIEMANIAAARIEHSEVAPGATLRVAVDILPYQSPMRTLRGQITLPPDIPEGDYQLIIGGAQAYTQLQAASQPYRNKVTNIDQLSDLLRRIMDVKSDALYLMIQRPEGGLAVGHTAMPHLPSSRTALLVSPTNNLTMPYQDLISQRVDTDLMILGQTAFQISVRQGAYGAKDKP